MRLSELQKESIRKAVLDNFGRDARVFLFGSRVDDTKKGGDIDLLVCVDAAQADLYLKKIKTITAIQYAIGDQRIDLVVTSDVRDDPRMVVKQAVKSGVSL